MSNCLCSSSFDATQCDLFHNERLCSLDSISDIVGTISGIENEAECQNRCTLDPACNHFMFIAFTNKDSKCFLLVHCTSDSKTCSDLEDCSNVITGPKTPALEEACCNELQDVICENESEIDHSYDITNSTECQTLCRNTIGCRYWSLYGQICFLYNACTTSSACLHSLLQRLRLSGSLHLPSRRGRLPHPHFGRLDISGLLLFICRAGHPSPDLHPINGPTPRFQSACSSYGSRITGILLWGT